MNTTIYFFIAATVALAPFAQARAGSCPPSLAFCGNGGEEITQMVRDCGVI